MKERKTLSEQQQELNDALRNLRDELARPLRPLVERLASWMVRKGRPR